jgi:hypothetical protein
METLVRIFDESLLTCDKLLVIVRIGQLDIHRSGGYTYTDTYPTCCARKKKKARKATIIFTKFYLY